MKPVQTWEVQTRGQVKSNRIHSSILRLSLRQYVEPQIDITFTLFPVSFTFLFRNLCKSSSRPCFPVPYLFLSDIICYLSLCTSAIQLMCEPCNVLQSGPRFDFLQPFSPFRTYASRLIAPAFQFPMDLCSASAIQPISFLLVVSQNFFNSIKIANLKSQVPSFAFHSEQRAKAKLHYRSTPLSGYSAKLQCCKSRRTPCQPSGSTRCPINMAQGSQRKPSRVD